MHITVNVPKFSVVVSHIFWDLLIICESTQFIEIQIRVNQMRMKPGVLKYVARMLCNSKSIAPNISQTSDCNLPYIWISANYTGVLTRAARSFDWALYLWETDQYTNITMTQKPLLTSFSSFDKLFQNWLKLSAVPLFSLHHSIAQRFLHKRRIRWSTSKEKCEHTEELLIL